MNKPNKYFDFSEALLLLRQGEHLARGFWKGKDTYVRLQRPHPGSGVTLAYLCLRTVEGNVIPWTASHLDLLTVDWFVVGHPTT